MTIIDFNKTVPPSSTSFKWSDLQSAIFDAITYNPSTSLRVDAVAGSGKTTTIVEGAKFISQSEGAAFLAFNKAIQVELSRRLPPFVEARTFNSVGFGALRGRIKNISPVGYKVNNHLREVAKIDSKDPLYKDLCRLLKLGKANGFGVEGFPSNDAGSWTSLMEASGVEIRSGDMARATHWLEKAYTRCLNDLSISDFDDQILFPVLYDWPLPTYDTIFVDEAQDLSPLQHEFLRRMTHPKTRIIAVGDPHQAIYGFRGADSQSMKKMESLFNMEKYPLSVTYRCRKAITEYAQSYVPHITCPDSFEEGAVTDFFGYDDDDPQSVQFEDGDLIMCRMNYPLFKMGMEFLRSGKPCQLMSDLPYQLENFIKSFKATTTKDLEKALHKWFEEETKEAEEENKGSRMGFLEDRYETVKVVMEGTTTVRSVLNNLKSLTSGDRGPTIATIHKSKGLEADRAFLLKPELIPSKWAKLPHQIEQEDNLMYVAITRAKHLFGRVHI